jgi:hypothetical protein
MDLAQTYGTATTQPFCDPRSVCRDVLPLRASIAYCSHLHSLCNLIHLLFRQFSISRERKIFGDGPVTSDRLAIDSRLPSDLPITLPRRPAAKHFSYVDHG